MINEKHIILICNNHSTLINEFLKPSDPNSGGYLSAHHYEEAGYGFHPSAAEVEEPFNPLKLLWYVVHYRWLIGIFVAVGLLAGGVATLMQTPKYSATARIEIMVPTARSSRIWMWLPSRATCAPETAREKLKSRDLARRSCSSLVSPTTPIFIRAILRSATSSAASSAPLPPPPARYANRGA